MVEKRREDLYFESIGSDFESFMSEYDVERRLRLIFDKLLVGDCSAANALEVGCGTGRISEILVKRVGSLQVCDISGILAEKVAARLSCAYSVQDACSLSLPSDSFDLIVSSECIEHTRDPFKALSEMKRVLRPGGRLIVTTPNKLWYPLLWLSQKTKIRKFAGPETWISPRGTKKWLKKNGFHIQKFGGCHLLPWQIPGIKSILPLLDNWDSALYPFMINFGFCAVKGDSR